MRISRLPRWMHWLYAWALRYFWLPCHLCGQPFGGHEWRDIGGKSSSINVVGFALRSNVYYHASRGVAICPSCTRQGLGE